MSTLAKYPRATAVTVYSLGVLLGLSHIFFGAVSLTPKLNQGYHNEMIINYNAFSKSLSFVHEFVGRASLALYLRYTISILEVIFGVFTLENGHFGPFSRVGNMGLMVVDFVFFVLQVLAGSSYERKAPTVVFFILLLARVVLADQANVKKAKPVMKTRGAGKPKTSTPKKNKHD